MGVRTTTSRGESYYMPPRSLNKMWTLYELYCQEVDNSKLAESSKTDYKMFADFFLRWIEGEFTPGGALK